MGTYNMMDLTPKGRDEPTCLIRWNGSATTTATTPRLPRTARLARAAPAGELLFLLPMFQNSGSWPLVVLASEYRRCA